MALIKCTECGKEISDKTDKCPNCGCPNEQFNKPKELPPEERPEMFNCVDCGRPLPVGINKCIYCNHVYGKVTVEDILNEQYTGISGKKGIFCPKCGSAKIKIERI